MRYFRGMICIVGVWGLSTTDAFEFAERPDRLDLVHEGKVWLSTITPQHDPNNREETYKVYTHVFAFDGSAPLTKGPGGLYTHHRGLFIGWKDTWVGGVDYDTWHMDNCYQKHVEWTELKTGNDAATQVEQLEWRTLDETAFIKEIRSITAFPAQDGSRVIDFESTLTSVSGDIQLKGDLHHAGMQIRMAQEVADHQDSTQYILPEGATQEANDKVPAAWWVCCSPVIAGKRLWIVHMTSPELVTGRPVYSIRRYARFGAFFEPTLLEGNPVTFRFRIVVSEKELDRAACQGLYDEYAKRTR
ncbi:MAG: hypothetical protein AMXMBFR4_21210 [Candidatus Hydrogenedentota bacterium]